MDNKELTLCRIWPNDHLTYSDYFIHVGCLLNLQTVFSYLLPLQSDYSITLNIPFMLANNNRTKLNALSLN